MRHRRTRTERDRALEGRETEGKTNSYQTRQTDKRKDYALEERQREKNRAEETDRQTGGETGR